MARSIIRKGGGAPADTHSAGAGGSAGAAVVPWQMDRLRDAATEAREAALALEPQPPVRPPEEELARIREQARCEGFAEGAAAGRAAGTREIAELVTLLGRVREVMDGFEQELAGDVMSVSLEVARQILRHTIHIHPEVVLPVIREAIASLPQGSVHPRLLLHPQDATLVRSVLDANQLTPAPWRIVEDSRLERGGCRVETSTSELDATVGARWKAVIAALGREERWVDLDGAGRATPSRPPRPAAPAAPPVVVADDLAGSAAQPAGPDALPTPVTGVAARREPR